MQSSQSAPSRKSVKRTLLAALAVFVLGCVSAPVALGADPSFTVQPASPIAGAEATFTPSDIPTGATVTWDFENSGTFESFATDTPATHTFADAGSYTVTMRVDASGPVTDYKQVVAVRPVVAFHRDPDGSVLLETGQAATFTSDSSPGSTLSWEIDGVAAGGEQAVTQSFAPGTHVVRLEGVKNGQRDTAISVFRVNAPPSAAFGWAPSTPVAGGVVQLFSTSVDAEGALAGEAWELDGDGDFNDALGSSATVSFSAGDHAVSLLVTDGDGVSRTVTRTITVAAPVTAAPPAKPPLMSPFPTVRLGGLVVPRGARITLVEVRGGPRGARVTVRCTGRGCPFRSKKLVATTGRVRVTQFPRILVAGARVEVFVRAPGVIGRYVAFRIRAGKPPVRTDRCLMPGASQPTRCT